MEESQTDSTSTRSGLVLFCGLLLNFVTMAAVIIVGYRRGLGDPNERHALQGILLLPLAGLELFFLARFCMRWKKKQDGGLALLLITQILFLLCGYSTEYSYGGIVALGYHNRDWGLMRVLGKNLEDYRSKQGHYPKSLKEFIASPQYKEFYAHSSRYLANTRTNSEVPCSSFGHEYPVRYALADSDSSHSGAGMGCFGFPDRIGNMTCRMARNSKRP